MQVHILSPNINMTVVNNMDFDPIGQVVNRVKTYSGGSKNDYNLWTGGKLMLKILINNEEVVCDKQLEIKEEMLSTSSCILNNCYPKSWENTKDYTSQYYYPKDYSKCLIYNDNTIKRIYPSDYIK